ncbi:MAG: homoserine dehydrogenase [Kiritimatiellae bacterium]|nr:homoserine dehydrogenase [Kiritimatiellia bacterium]
MAMEIGIGILGLGTVGTGVAKWLQANGALIEKRTGLKLVLRGLADIDPERDRGLELPAGLLTRDAEKVIADPEVKIVVETIGGIEHARKYILQALKLKKPVVTANKALLAEDASALFQEAERNKTGIFFEASVGGGIPVIRSLRDGLVSNNIENIYGILNGTCNYILTRMEQSHSSFAAALKEAQKEGFAETDPALDIDGLDTAHKAVILASLVCGFKVPMSAVPVEGIRALAALDMHYAMELGYRVKLLAVINGGQDGVSVRVHPALVPHKNILASVNGVFNAVLIRGDGVGDVLGYGIGAGRDSTASAILSDVAEAARDLMIGAGGAGGGFCRYLSGFRPAGPGDALKPAGEEETRCYLRLTLLDKPGMFGQVGTLLGRHAISIASVLQKENCRGRHVPVIIITHHAPENAFRAAIKELDAMPGVGAGAVCIRIEDF